MLADVTFRSRDLKFHLIKKIEIIIIIYNES